MSPGTRAEDFADSTEARRALDVATDLVDAADQILSRGVLTTF
ncbi:hypothetical protein [Phycicoccus sp. CSK15P-2]|nr:hypothetical protein [Phycicoccus sp. CSK15P-2]